jgi:hypothetical protein
MAESFGATGPFEHRGGIDNCTGCGEIIHSGDLVAPITPDRPDRLVCVGCWWRVECDLPLPAWTPRRGPQALH